jgi:fructose-bisphosphate aldolase class I
LQQSAIEQWGGLPENVPKGQAAFFRRAAANSLASVGKYTGEQEGAIQATSSLYQKDYKY